MIMAGRTWPIRPASSAVVLRGFTATATAPIDVSASQLSRYAGVVAAVSITRSPDRTPASASAAAVRPTAATAPANVSSPSSLRSQVPSGSRSAAASSSRGMVPW